MLGLATSAHSVASIFAFLATWLMAAITFAQSTAKEQGVAVQKREGSSVTLVVQKTDAFDIIGDGRAAAWKQADWQPLTKRTKNGLSYEARFKVLYSDHGLYVLMDGDDEKLTATMQEDFLNLWTEDVWEFFLWTDERLPIYFEYEISPLGYELPILIPNVDGHQLGWRPWNYEGKRKIKKLVVIRDGEQKSGATIKGWSAEVFVPYDLLKPLGNVPPKPGTQWRANFYRVDHDHGRTTGWQWSPVGPSFHDFKNFGTLEFK